MKVKLLEIRDKATFIPVAAITTNPINEEQRYLLRRSGYGLPSSLIILLNLGHPSTASFDPYDWNTGARTYPIAHDYIVKNFDNLKNGDVIDVEHILGETTTVKISERLEFFGGY